ITATRRFALAAWFFLGVGIILGARWSYAELGWGGYWAWDPVENASLLPWLTGTAFIHSLMIQEKRGMLKVWNSSLVLTTGILAILGTFLVRSGILDSIHAFGASTLGVPFVTLIALMIVASVYLVVSRRAALRSEHRLDSLLSREAAFLGNNLVLVGLAFVVFWGTFFPLISEAVTGQKAAVGPPWFDRYTVPLALVLVLLTGIGPVIAWRRATWANARRAFAVPAAAGAATLAALVALGVTSSATALLMFAFCAFAIAVAAQELWRGTGARRAMSGEPAPLALVSLVRRNRRRYGGYLVHVGIAVIFIGVAASSAFQHARDARLQVGQSARVGPYDVRYVRATSGIDVRAGDVERIRFGSVLEVTKDGRHVATLRPDRSYYPSRAIVAFGPVGRFFEGESTSDIGMRAGPLRDVWTAVQPDTSRLKPLIDEGNRLLVRNAEKLTPREGSIALAQILGGLVTRYAKDPPPAQFRFLATPLVAWIWAGGLLVFTGGLIALWPAPDAARRRATAGYAARVARELGRA
ncbi:MAG TPA: cytochrome c-type biogenesis CcmF C-terminal domain-containing protein, partial [Solirubrobacteraceae bacterium]|nr:cytochrome c-type biogenesis CcmF C-terminal domain-containing protein [Solirubrobacteraceae bacterium]